MIYTEFWIKLMNFLHSVSTSLVFTVAVIAAMFLTSVFNTHLMLFRFIPPIATTGNFEKVKTCFNKSMPTGL